MNSIFVKCSVALSALFTGGVAIADIDCGPALVQHVQIERSLIYVHLVGQNWHLLGSVEAAGTRERYSALLAAQMSGRKVALRYPDGYDCNAYNLSTEAIMVRTYSD